MKILHTWLQLSLIGLTASVWICCSKVSINITGIWELALIRLQRSPLGIVLGRIPWEFWHTLGLW